MGPEKRLPLALVLCFLILFGWSYLNAPTPEEGAGATTEEPAVEGAAVDEVAPASPGKEEVAAPSAPTPDATPDAAPTVEPWSDWVELGVAGSEGHAFVRFDSLGGSVAEIRLGGFFVREGLSDEDRSGNCEREIFRKISIKL